MERECIKDFSFSRLRDLVLQMGQPAYRAKQLAGWVFKKGVLSFDLMTDLPAEMRAELSARYTLGGLVILRRQCSSRGETTKYLFGLSDGQAVESVLMVHNYGRTVCVSTQVGCRMGCRLCASGLGGLVRNLKPGEIYDQVLTVQREAGVRISHVVLMGTGEPLDNYENTLVFLEHLTAPYGLNISYRRITLSTCGLVPEIRALAQMGLPLTLAVSLHAPNNRLRDEIVPINRRYPLEELLAACREYSHRTGRRVTFEYALWRGVNDSHVHAEELGRILRGMLCHVNLIPANPVAERGVKRSTDVNIRRFRQVLERYGVPVTVRRELGADIDAACGQLRRRMVCETKGSR